jgi:hypothetical protein
VFDQVGIAVIVKASGQLPQDAQLPLDLAQQQAPGVRGDPPTVKSSHHIAVRKGVKSE